MWRSIEKQLQEWRNSNKRSPLILKGARQIGKTHSLLDFGKQNFQAVHYINFENDKQLHSSFEYDFNTERILKEISLYLKSSINIQRDLVIFDEIQECPKAITSLKYFKENLPELAIASAGSLLGVQLSNESFPVGKVDYLHMFPMSFLEFLKALGEDQLYSLLSELKLDDRLPELVHEQLWQILKIYFVTGGLPAVIDTYLEYRNDSFLAFTEVRKKQNAIITDYNSDIAKHSGKENSMHISRLWSHISIQLSRELDASVHKFKFKGVLPGQSRYSRLAGCIDWLLAAGLIIKIPITNSAQLPFKAYTEDSKFKLLIFDVGILGALSELSPSAIMQYSYGSYKGYFAENYVAQEFIYKQGFNGNLYSWKQNTAEIEFLQEINAQAIPVEVKSGWVTKAQSLRAFGERYDPSYKVIFSANKLDINHSKKLHKYPLYLASLFPLAQKVN